LAQDIIAITRTAGTDSTRTVVRRRTGRQKIQNPPALCIAFRWSYYIKSRARETGPGAAAEKS
jgi:hypothetical protein